MKRILSLCLCIALFIGLFCGCSEEAGAYIPTGDALDVEGNRPNDTTSPEEQDLTMVYYPELSMNPYTATNYTNRTLLPLMYQGLFCVNRNYEAVPILCQTYRVSGDMKTYTIYLAQARFSDGTALTAQDVVASLNAAKTGGYYAGRFLHITSIAAEGSAVVIQLDTPCETLPLLLDIPIVKASEVNAAMPLGTGPYVMDNALSSKRLRKQAAWWCSKESDLIITSSYIPLVEAESPSQIRDQFEFEDVGLVCADPGSDTYADYRCDYEIWDCENGLFLYLGTHEKSPVFSNASVRRALTHAIDRDLLVETYYRGFARSTTLPASPLSPFYNSQLASRYTYNKEKFTAALAEAQMQSASITLLLNSDDSLRLRVGRRIAQMLTDCGLKVTLLELTTEKYVEHLKWGSYDLYLAQTKLSPNMDLTAFFRQGGALSYGGLSDAATYAMAREALANQGNYYNLHELIMEDGQLCPILIRSYAVYATRGLVTNLQPSRDNLFCYSLGKTLNDVKITE